MLPVCLVVAATGRAATPPSAATPWLLSAEHVPPQPRSGEAVRIIARTAPGTQKLILQYQVVEPGRYIELKDPAFKTSWLSRPMTDGIGRERGAVFSAELPAALQRNRWLVRYRFAATDGQGRTLLAPGAEEPVPNFAYFVYDGVPAWTGAINARSGEPRQRVPVAVSAEEMGRVQAYHLLGKKTSIENVTWREPVGGREYRYTATLAVGGVVFDHIRFRARGGVWRYAMGKNMWKFDFPSGHHLPARDDYGQPSLSSWSKVNLRACIQQGDYGHRGEQGMFEAVGFRLFNLAGVAAPQTHWIQLRIIDEPEENPADQYRGDFWGLYLAIEDVDGHFLKNHHLPDGNIYRMDGGGGTLCNQGAHSVTNRSDLDRFLNAYNSRAWPESWWQTNLDLSSYFSYRAVLECIHHYDVSDGKNYYYYLNPASNRWQVVPWDIDLTWADNMYGGGNEPFSDRVLALPALRLEYQNRLREIRDLLYNPEQTGLLIDECAAVIWTPGRPSMVDADRAKWDFHPIMAMGGKAGQGLFYQITPTKDFAGMVRLMKDYVKQRGEWIDLALLRDPRIPVTPTVTYTGPAGFPANRLRFRASPYQGASAFAAMKWRLAEITPAGAPRRPGLYEIAPLWESPDLSVFAAESTVPAGLVKTGHTYRVRVRTKDATGRWSHWSGPFEFVAGKS
jgi:hypothetical protein